MTRTLVVWGSSSGAGKSWLATALCRLARRRGIGVAPFKAQNMSNNARVVQASSGWGEIGSAQYLQALAAGVIPHTDHNPVLLKPETETRSQVVVNGVVQPALGAMPWRARAPHLATAARPAFERLARRHELIVVEGAGSPAEINLADVDVVNLHTARWARDAGRRPHCWSPTLTEVAPLRMPTAPGHCCRRTCGLCCRASSSTASEVTRRCSCPAPRN